jgi:uncharacterized cupin superfamily protein
MEGRSAERAAEEAREPREGDGYAVANIDALGEGQGFRKIRRALGVDAFGINAIVMPGGYTSIRHYHEEQEETYFVHRGRIEIEFGDGSRHLLTEGGVARVDAQTVRSLHNPGTEDAVYLAIGGKGGYVGRDGRRPDDEPDDFVGPDMLPGTRLT